jgi:signal peptidase I
MQRAASTLRLIVQPLAIAIVLALALRTALHIYSIPSASMAPTLVTGDHILVTPYRGWLGDAQPQRGDVVVFRSPLDARELMVKRIVAVPGDLIATAMGRVTVGGHTLAETYVANVTSSGTIAPQIVAQDRYFVMGDNRGDSYDSRNWGALPRDLVVGHARLVLWSSADGFGAPASASQVQTPLGRVTMHPEIHRIFLRIH